MNLSVVAELSSILGFLGTFFLSRKIRKEKARHTLLVRAPKVLQDLEKCASNISNCMNDFEDYKISFLDELAKAEGPLESIIRISPRDKRKKVSRVLKTVEKYDINSRNAKDKAREIYRDINKVINGFDNLLQDVRVM